MSTSAPSTVNGDVQLHVKDHVLSDCPCSRAISGHDIADHGSVVGTSKCILSVPVNAMLHDKCIQFSLYGIHKKFKLKGLGLQIPFDTESHRLVMHLNPISKLQASHPSSTSDARQKEVYMFHV